MYSARLSSAGYNMRREPLLEEKHTVIDSGAEYKGGNYDPISIACHCSKLLTRWTRREHLVYHAICN